MLYHIIIVDYVILYHTCVQEQFGIASDGKAGGLEHGGQRRFTTVLILYYICYVNRNNFQTYTINEHTMNNHMLAVGVKYYTPEIPKVNIHLKLPLNIHWTIPLKQRQRHFTTRKLGWYGWKPSSSLNLSIPVCRVHHPIRIRQHILYRALWADSISVPPLHYGQLSPIRSEKFQSGRVSNPRTVAGLDLSIITLWKFNPEMWAQLRVQSSRVRTHRPHFGALKGGHARAIPGPAAPGLLTLRRNTDWFRLNGSPKWTCSSMYDVKYGTLHVAYK